MYKLNRKLRGDPAESYKRGIIKKKDIKLLIDTYDAEIRYVDYCVSRIYGELEKLNLLNKTYMFITGDHGEEFFEHGGYHSNTNLYE